MANTDFTPGPWKADDEDMPDGRRDVEPNTARVNGGFIVASCFGSQRVANASLIAAAPELLASLKDCMSRLNACRLIMHDDEARNMAGESVARARAVIAKATGPSR